MSRVDAGNHTSERHHSKRVVLVVDRDPLIVSVLTGLLTSKNYSVIKAYSGSEALKILQHESVDAVLCDMTMPGMSGFEFLEQVQKGAGSAAPPVVFLIAGGEAGRVSFVGEGGVGQCIPKPIEPHSLLAAVRDAISRQATPDLLAKQDFDAYRKRVVRTLSHEFRTPLSAITTGTELLLDQRECLSSEKATHLLEAVRRGSMRLEKLVRDFLTLQQMEAGITQEVFSSHAVCVSVSELLQRFVDTKTPPYCSERFQFQISDQSHGSKVKVVESNIIDCLDRLVSNAVKFSNGPDHIEICTKLQGREVHFAVSDRGCGLDPHQIGVALQVFGQIDRDHNEQQGGGMGLPIACKHATTHRGRIEFKVREGGGSVVTLVLPQAEATPSDDGDPLRREQ